MTPPQRDSAAVRIKACALTWSVGFASPQEIDSLGIMGAGRLAAQRALDQLSLTPDYLLTDFRLALPDLDLNYTSLVRGDGCCLSIAAASVLAKTARDALMRELDLELPGYGLAAHKGYGTLAHRRALRKMGTSPIHRKSFSLGL
jgi:ribonuclease HII